MSTPTAAWYQRKPQRIEAMRCTPETADTVAAWCGGEAVNDPKPSDPTDVRIYVRFPTLQGAGIAEATLDGGDYLLRTVHGVFQSCNPRTFEDQYEPTSPPPQLHPQHPGAR